MLGSLKLMLRKSKVYSKVKASIGTWEHVRVIEDCMPTNCLTHICHLGDVCCIRIIMMPLIYSLCSLTGFPI